MIKAVVFDVGRVLFQWQLRSLIEKIISDPEECDFVLCEVVTEQWHFEHDQGRMLADMVAERKALFPQYGYVLDAYASRFNETIPGPVPGSIEIVEELAERAIPLFAITNFGAEFWDGFAPQQPVFGLFGDIVVSGKELLVKPDPAIYALAERRFGHAAGDMLFIDDNEANIASAKACGWQTHLFSNAERLREDLAARELLAS